MSKTDNFYSISVRGLVEFILRNGDISGGDGSFSPEAMAEGARIHKKIQSRMGSNYKPEVPLKIDVVREDFVLTVEGRADGIIEDKKGVTIDEIKGVYKKLDTLVCPEILHRAQAMCYAYIYSVHNDLEKINVQVTYCNMDTEEIKRFKEELTFEELSSWWKDLIDEYCKFISFEVDERKIRNDSIENLEFPYEYRSGQRDMTAAVYMSIKEKKTLFVQAPTGIGKTMATIFPTVKAMGEGRAEKVFYLTAKTIARQVASDGFAILRENGLHFRSVLITAKEKICPMDKTECDPALCPYAKGHYDRINDAIYDCITTYLDIDRDVILECADKHMVCPFELSLDVSLFVDGIICDYNYVFDPKVKLRRYFAEGAKGEFIFLVDEAHNLVDRASEMYSASIFKESFLQIRKLIKPYNEKLAKILKKCNDEILKIKKECDGKEYVIVEDMSELHLQLLRAMTHFSSFLEELNDIKALSNDMDEIMEFYFMLHHFINMYDLVDESYEIYGQQTEEGFMVRLYCIHTANNLAECIEKSNSTIFFSATMLPIRYYKELLHKVKDNAVYIPSPFPKENREILVATDVSSRYKMRGPEMYTRIARYASIMAHSREGKYMVFFPSYKMMEDVFDAAMDLAECDDLNIVCQRQNMTERQREEFLEMFTEDDEPVVGFCTLGGIFSEGIDLVGDSLIGVAVVGTGLPMVCNEREIQKNYFDERAKDGFSYAYLYPGMNKVQQAAGRLIRTMDDKGVILLLDDRFIQKSVVDTFPAEWADYKIVNLSNVASAISSPWQ